MDRYLIWTDGGKSIRELAHPAWIPRHQVDRAYNAGSPSCLAHWCPENQTRAVSTVSPEPKGCLRNTSWHGKTYTRAFGVCILRSLGPSLTCIKIQNNNYSVAAPEVLHPHPTTQQCQKEKLVLKWPPAVPISATRQCQERPQENGVGDERANSGNWAPQDQSSQQQR